MYQRSIRRRYGEGIRKLRPKSDGPGLEQLLDNPKLFPRRYVERILRRKVSDSAWWFLVEERAVSELRSSLYKVGRGKGGWEHDEEAWSNFESLLRKYEWSRKFDRPRRASKPKVKKIGLPDELLRYRYRIHTIETGELPEIAAFREKHLPGGLLAPEDVHEWIMSRPRPLVPFGYQVRLSAPIGSRERPGPATVRDLLEALKELPDHELDDHVEHMPSDEVLVYYKVPGEKQVRTRIVHGSEGVLAELKVAAKVFVKHFSWKSAQAEADAVVFVLTGRFPDIPKALVSINKHSPQGYRVRIDADIRVNPSEVAALYREARNELSEYAAGKAFPQRKHSMEDHKLVLAEFLAKHPGETWRALMAKWNEERPQWAYDDVRKFATYARRYYERLTGKKWIHER